jgi:hexosaminidase
MKKFLLLFLFVCVGILLYGQSLSIIPQPRSVKPLNGSFVISPKTRIVFDKPALLSAQYFNNYLDSFYHFKIKKSGSRKTTNTITLNLSSDFPDSAQGAYSLECNNNKVIIKSRSPEGIFYGIQTLIQLLPVSPTTSGSLAIPNVAVKDVPRFAYRGMMLDAGRHFMPVEFVKKFIDYLALHKMNTFHWHLTEDQGWRIEIKKYPRLTEVGAWRNGTIVGHYPQSKKNDCLKTGGFYTQAQIKEVVKYAADRYITIIPEIEMPGHSSAAIAAYPQLSCFPDSATEKKLDWCPPAEGKQVQQTWGVFKDVYAPTPYTFHFIEDVLDEVMELFPSRYIHIGGDECPKIYWKESAYCQNLIRQEGLKNEEGLQSYFISKIEKYLNSKGCAIIGWDEILEGGLAPNATVQSWRGERGGVQAAKLKHNVIMSPNGVLYLTQSQIKDDDSLTVGGYLPISKIYHYDPVGKMDSASQKYVIGAESCLWTEYMKSPAKVEYMMFPRMAAVSEVFWSDPKLKNYDNFVLRLAVQVERYGLWNINYCVKYTQ